MDVAIDNSIISKYLQREQANNKERKDIDAFTKMIALAKRGEIELGGPGTTLLIENFRRSSPILLKKYKEELEEIMKFWPVVDPDPDQTDQIAKEAHKLFQDKGGNDSRQFVLVSRITRANYLVTMDYRFRNRFHQIKRKLFDDLKLRKINVITPTEFCQEYENMTTHFI